MIPSAWGSWQAWMIGTSTAFGGACIFSKTSGGNVSGTWNKYASTPAFCKPLIFNKTKLGFYHFIVKSMIHIPLTTSRAKVKTCPYVE